MQCDQLSFVLSGKQRILRRSLSGFFDPPGVIQMEPFCQFAMTVGPNVANVELQDGIGTEFVNENTKIEFIGYAMKYT